jgi:hypothetical protein
LSLLKILSPLIVSHRQSPIALSLTTLQEVSKIITLVVMEALSSSRVFPSPSPPRDLFQILSPQKVHLLNMLQLEEQSTSPLSLLARSLLVILSVILLMEGKVERSISQNLRQSLYTTTHSAQTALILHLSSKLKAGHWPLVILLLELLLFVTLR